MNSFIDWVKRNPNSLYWTCLLLLFPAFWINLGAMPLFADEPIRGLVALEMMIRDNWIVPTMNGALYFNKPPFYNWLIIFCIELFNSASEWVIRLPSIVPFFLYGGTIYWFFKDYLGRNIAFLAAIFFMTCGRLLIYASLLGHIDIFYSWITFISFIIIFEFFRKEKWLSLFVFSYLLAAIGFLCKGMPSIVFQGLTLLGWFAYKKRFWKLFSWQHLVGGFVFLGILGGYAFLYNQTHPIEDLLSTLWSQSSKRTVLAMPWYKTLGHFVIFPFEVLYHILPWSLLVIFCLRRDFFRKVQSNEILSFSLITFLINIPVYWASPGTLPRYLFMLYPFLFVFFAAFYEYGKEESGKEWMRKGIENIFLIVGIMLTLAVWVPVVKPVWVETSGIIWKSIALFAGLVVSLYLYLKLPAYRMMVFAIILLLGRIGFDFFILSTRAEQADYTKQKNYAFKVAEIAENKPLKIIKSTPVDYHISYYITRERDQILPFVKQSEIKDTSGYYIVSKSIFEELNAESVYRFRGKWEDSRLILARLREVPG